VVFERPRRAGTDLQPQAMEAFSPARRFLFTTLFIATSNYFRHVVTVLLAALLEKGGMLIQQSLEALFVSRDGNIRVQ